MSYAVKTAKAPTQRLVLAIEAGLLFGLVLVRSITDAFSSARISVFGFGLNVNALMSLVILAFVVCRWPTYRATRVPRLYKVGFLAYGGLSAIGVVTAYTMFGRAGLLLAVEEFVRYLYMAAVFVLATRVLAHSSYAELMQRLLPYTLVVPALVGVWQWATNTGLHTYAEPMNRVYGTFAHPNAFGLYMVLIVLVISGLWAVRQKANICGIIGITLLLSFTGEIIVLTYSRAALLEVLGALFVFWCLTFWQRVFALRKLVPFALAIVIVGSSSAKIINTRFADLRTDDAQVDLELRWKELSGALGDDQVGNTQTEDPGMQNSVSWRLTNWRQLLELWAQKPYTGYGLSTTVLVNPWKTGAKAGYAAHNEIVRVLVETGIIGLLGYLTLIVGMGLHVTKKSLLCSNGVMSASARMRWIVAVAFFAVYLVDGLLTGDPFTHTATLSYYLIWLALCEVGSGTA